MRANSLSFLAICLIGARLLSAQVVSSVEIRDPALRALQEQSFNNLKTVGQNITSHQFAFPFYLSRSLDIDEKAQKRTDQHSIRFEHYNGSTVIAISGNYYGAYAADKFNEEQRARKTFQDVIVPILKNAVPVLQGNAAVQGYAVEVSHHVINKTMGMPIERPENLLVYFPRDAAQKLVAAQNVLALQAALLDADVLLNARQLSLWLTDDGQVPVEETAAASNRVEVAVRSTTAAASESIAKNVDPRGIADERVSMPPANPGASVTPAPATPPAPPVRDLSPKTLAELQSAIQGASDRMLKELGPEAHFVVYAPPSLVPFHHQVFLEISMSTALAEPLDASRYKLAALAFDEHVSPLIRRVLAYFTGEQNFDGISFSTTIHRPTKPGAVAAKPLSVEFFLPLETLRRYASYDCTGQQLINDGIVLINGERAGLDLELAQGSSRQ